MNNISPGVKEQSTTITLDLYPQEFSVLDRAARITGIRSRSATIRHIINDWARQNLPESTGNGKHTTETADYSNQPG